VVAAYGEDLHQEVDRAAGRLCGVGDVHRGHVGPEGMRLGRLDLALEVDDLAASREEPVEVPP
jgi:hypothetical protein